MKYRTLGTTSLSVSEISLGCMSLGRDQKTNEHIIRTAYESGINLFDTADLYELGWNEESVGKALSGIREKVVLATKVGNEWNEDGSWHWNPSKDYILKAVDESLRRLGTDYIDLYQLHGGTIEDPIDETIEAFEILKEQGKIREYGISSIRPNVIREYVNRSNIVSVMMQYSLLDRRPEEEVFGVLEEAGISVLCRGVLAKGMLVDKPAKEYLGYSMQETGRMRQEVQKCDNPMGEVLGYTLGSKVVGSNVVGIRTLEQLVGVLEGYEGGAGSSHALGQVLEPNRYELHR